MPSQPGNRNSARRRTHLARRAVKNVPRVCSTFSYFTGFFRFFDVLSFGHQFAQLFGFTPQRVVVKNHFATSLFDDWRIQIHEDNKLSCTEGQTCILVYEDKKWFNWWRSNSRIEQLSPFTKLIFCEFIKSFSTKFQKALK